MVGLGVANLAAGFFQGFPVSSSSSRTPVAEAAGARTQLTGVVGALAIAALLLVAPTLLQDLPQRGAGGRRHRGGDRPVRDRRPAAHLSHPALGVLAVDGLLRRRRGVRRDSRHRARGRDRRDRVPLGRLAAAFGGARAASTASRATTTSPAIREARQHPGPGAVPLGCAAVLRQRRALPRPGAGRGGELADAGALGRRRGRAGHERRRHRRRRRWPNSTTACAPQASSSASPR